MDQDTIAQTINFIKNDSPSLKKRINFFGGEPLLEWQTIQAFTETLPVETYSLTTNGTLLDEEKCRYLSEHRFRIALSLDGPPGVTRKTRPGSENVDIDLITEHFPEAQIIITLTPENISDCYNSTMWFLNKGFINIAHNIATEKKWPETAIEEHFRQFEKLSDYLIYNASDRNINFMFTGFAVKAVNNSVVPREKRNICGSSPNLLAIDTNGDIYPCQDMVTCDAEKKYKIGSVFTGYTSPERISLNYVSFPSDFTCKSCWFYHQCVGGCGPKNLLVCGDRFKAQTNGCRLYSDQVSLGLKVLLNTGKLKMRRS
jgi:uncharacterized protein